MTLLILYLFIALFFSFVCSILEAVILSITPSFIAIQIQENSPLKKELAHIRDNIDRPLAAILTLNTFAHTLGAAGVGAQAQALWGNRYLSLVSALLTILILIFSEIIPKTLGSGYWRELAPFSLRILRVMEVLLYPFIVISRLVTRLFKKERGAAFTRRDLHSMAEIVRSEGGIRDEESRIIQNLMRFNRIRVRDIMTPRTVVTALPDNLSITDIADRIDDIPFSRIPLYHGDLDTITGFVLRDDILSDLAKPDNRTLLKDISREIHTVPEQVRLLSLLGELVHRRSQICVVIDEYGGTGGVVTMEDLMETLLGLEIMDEMDQVEDLRKMAREKAGSRFEIKKKKS